jgi:tetratricopeptide (TPR) repeat protein
MRQLLIKLTGLFIFSLLLSCNNEPKKRIEDVVFDDSDNNHEIIEEYEDPLEAISNKAQSGDLYGAMADYNTYIAFHPEDGRGYHFRADLKIRLEDYRGAINDCSKAISLVPDNYWFLISRAFAKEKLKDFKGAILDYDKIIQLQPTDKCFYYKRGLLKHEARDFRGAINDYNKVQELKEWGIAGVFILELNEFGIETSYLIDRGKTKLKLGQKNSACLDFSEAGQLGNVKAYDLIKIYCN